MRGTAVTFVVLLACYISLVVAYSTSGNKILDASGKTVLLRGIARPSLEWSTTGESLSLSDYSKMKSWGANVVRLSLSQCSWLAGGSYQQTVDQQVSWIKSLGMGVILDLHWSGSSCAQQNMADAQSNTFWQQVATKYKNDGSIIFELYNEPHDVSWSVWKSGGSGYVGFQTLYNTVRATGANNVVIINGLNYAYDLSGVPTNLISGSNIIYGSHPYNFGGKQKGDWPGNFNPLLANYPIITTEFGNTVDCGTQYYSDWIAYADANCISWTAWGWYPKDCAFPSLITDWNATPSGSGVIVKASLGSGPKCGSSGSTTASATTASATTRAATTTTTTGGTAAKKFVFDDTLQNGFQDWGFGTHSLAITNPVFAGTKSISFTLVGNSGLYFHVDTPFSPSSYASLVFVYNANGNNGLPFLVSLKDASNNDVGSKVSVTVSGSSWVTQTIPISSFGVSGSSTGFMIFFNSGSSVASNVYFDNIYFA